MYLREHGENCLFYHPEQLLESITFILDFQYIYLVSDACALQNMEDN